MVLYERTDRGRQTDQECDANHLRTPCNAVAWRSEQQNQERAGGGNRTKLVGTG